MFRADSVALIQVIRDCYSAAGVDIQPRINRYITAQGWGSYESLTDEQIKQLAEAMRGAYLKERSALKINLAAA